MIKKYKLGLLDLDFSKFVLEKKNEKAPSFHQFW